MMRIPFLHPASSKLNEFADGTLDPGERRRVADHLADCDDCRRHVAKIRDIGEVAEDLARVEPPEGALEEILRRREVGDRVVLPASDPGQPTRSWMSMAVAAGVVAVAGSAVLFSMTSDAEADRSVLRFEPTAPTAGATIQVEYEPTVGLGDDERLRLRGRLRTPTDEAYNREMEHVDVTTLRRSDDGTFRGSFTLPDSVVYATFAVEDHSSSMVDSNARRLWELMIRSDEGIPLYDALVQRANDLMGRNWELAYESARQASELYPDRPESWSRLLFYQEAVLGEAARDSLLEIHRPLLRRFDERYRGREDVPKDLLNTMMWYARSVGDSAVEMRWRNRFLDEAPRNPYAMQERVLDIPRRDHPDGPEGALAELEALWDETDPVPGELPDVGYRHLVRWGFWSARDAGDTTAMRTWAHRRLRLFPESRPYVASSLVEIAELRGEGIRLLEEELAELEQAPDDDRILRRTREEHLKHLRDPRRRVLSDLADALMTEGDTAAALSHFERAADLGWDTDIFRRAADAHLAVKEAEEAGRLLARIAVDPGASGAYADTARTLLGAAFDPEAWSRWTSEAGTAMRKVILEDAVSRRLSDAIRLRGPDGVRMRLREASGDGPTLVVFWSRFCGPAIQALPEIDATAERLAASGVETLVITDEAPSAELSNYLTEKDVTLPLYHDTRREATEAFNSWGTPQYFVLDGQDRIRFEHSELSEVIRQVNVVAPTDGQRALES